MRPLLSALLLIVLLGFRPANTPANELDGTWLPIKQEFSGTALPPASFEKESLVISNSTYVFTAESVDKGEARYADGKMDIYGKEGVNAGKHFTAIYKLEDGQLYICYNLKGDAYPESFDTKGKPLHFLSVFKKG
ncbi:MAG: TIGR03067 domain-containing protein [Chitinophagaceae bacterium]|nr:TIGR03067 domain-containing protein [Chitinophagaceae bacterium]